jgi:hypothetical protein
VWFAAGEEADLAVQAGGETIRLTTTAPGELLDDVAPDGRLLFEREGQLVEMAGAMAGALGGGRPVERVLARGRDGRYTPDGRHVLFARGNESEPLAQFRQGYDGGDDSDLHLLDLATLAVTPVTDAPGNDECPLPLDDAGRRFIVCRERDGPYRPWFVQAVSPRMHRVRRFPMPEGRYPILFPALRRAGAEWDLVAEADGRLLGSVGAIGDTGFAFWPARPLRIVLEPGGLGAASGRGGARFDEVGALLAAEPVTRERWRTIPERVRRRFRAEMERTDDPGAADDLLRRLLGRLGLPGVDLNAAGAELPAAVVDRTLAQALADSGCLYVPAARPTADLALDLGASGTIVLDLRGAHGGIASPDSLAAVICGSERIVVLIDEKTYGRPEVLAERLKAQGCARLAGRPTAGAVIATESHPLATGGALVLPAESAAAGAAGALAAVPGGPAGAGGAGVIPDYYVPPREDPATEPWLATALRAVRRLGR